MQQIPGFTNFVIAKLSLLDRKIDGLQKLHLANYTRCMLLYFIGNLVMYNIIVILTM